MTDNTCKTCRYWTASGLIGTRQNGKCLKNAPTVSPQGITWWPDTVETDWCGEWKAKSPAQTPNTLGEIMGKWPGDETEEELLEGLAEIDGDVDPPRVAQVLKNLYRVVLWLCDRVRYGEAEDIPDALEDVGVELDNAYGVLSDLDMLEDDDENDHSAPKTRPRPAEKLKLIGMCDMGIGEDPYKMRFWPDVDGYYPDFGAPGPCKVRFAFKKPGEDLEWSEDFNLFTLDRLELRDDGVYKNAEKILELSVKGK